MFPTRPSWMHPRAAPLLTLAFVAAAFACWLAFDPPALKQLMSEEGPVEQATAIGYGLAAIAVWLLCGRLQAPSDNLALSIVCLAFGARELDLHKAWTDGSVLSARFYSGPVPITQKLVALAVLLPIVLALVHLLRRHARDVYAGWRRRETVSVTIVTFTVTMLLTKALDRSLNVYYEATGTRLPEALYHLQAPFEEVTELALPALILLALLQQRRRLTAEAAALRSR